MTKRSVEVNRNYTNKNVPEPVDPKLRKLAITKIGYEFLLNTRTGDSEGFIPFVIVGSEQEGDTLYWVACCEPSSDFAEPLRIPVQECKLRELSVEELLTHGNKRVRDLGYKRQKRK